MKVPNWLKFIIALAVTFAAAAVGSIATFSQIPTWYESLNKTVLSPPNWVFGPVWTLLYILMAVAAFLIWREGIEKPEVRHRLVLYVEQLVLNAMWSVSFFGQHQILLSFGTILILWFVILLMVEKFFQLSRAAGWLLIPYLAWVGFASVLNYLTWVVNK